MVHIAFLLSFGYYKLTSSGVGISLPLCDCSTLELISPDGWITMDGYVATFSCHNCLNILRYEFAPNEYINALECVTLETFSTEAGTKEFIAIGTSIDRGEDLAVKGAVGSLLEFTIPESLIILSRHTYLRLWRLCLSSQINDGTDSNCGFVTMPRVRLQRFAVLTDIWCLPWDKRSARQTVS